MNIRTSASNFCRSYRPPERPSLLSESQWPFQLHVSYTMISQKLLIQTQNIKYALIPSQPYMHVYVYVFPDTGEDLFLTAPALTLNGQPMERVHQCKYPRVVLTDNLTWSAHNYSGIKERSLDSSHINSIVYPQHLPYFRFIPHL